MSSDVISLSPDLLDHLAGSTTILMTLRERVTRENALVLTNISFTGMGKIWEHAEST